MLCHDAEIHTMTKTETGIRTVNANNSSPEKKNERRASGVYGAEKIRAGGGASIRRADYGVE